MVPTKQLPHAESYRKIGNRVRALRKRKKLTQERLAKLVGLTRTSITNIEKGRQRFPFDLFLSLVSALSVGPEELLPPSIVKMRPEVKAKVPKEYDEVQRRALTQLSV